MEGGPGSQSASGRGSLEKGIKNERVLHRCQKLQCPVKRAWAAQSPKLFSSSTTLPRLVLWISGTVVSSSSCW